MERKALQCFFQRRYGRNRKSHLYISYQEINNCSLWFLVSDRSNLALCSHTSCLHLSLFLATFGLITQTKCVYFWKGYQQKTKFSNIILFPLQKNFYFWFKFSKINDKKEIIIIPNNLIAFVESFQTVINFWFGLQNIKGLHHF